MKKLLFFPLTIIVIRMHGSEVSYYVRQARLRTLALMEEGLLRKRTIAERRGIETLSIDLGCITPFTPKPYGFIPFKFKREEQRKAQPFKRLCGL